jgi:putative component of membrane protein insertase Oxa1/YidC/SpoIIIJ protein YidD
MSMLRGRIQGSRFGIRGTEVAGPSFSATFAAAAIRGYQRWISPYKGFRCAHRLLHGRHSCSEFARLAILEHGVVDAWPGIRQQFGECRAAALFLRDQRRASLNSSDSDSDAEPETEGYELGGSDESDPNDRTIDDRFYDESEKKRKRLAELPSHESPLANISDWCFQCTTCGFLERFICCSPW